MENEPSLFPLDQIIDSAKDTTHLGKPRLKMAVRNQVEFRAASLEDLIPQDHLVRLVWGYVQKLDMSSILGTIKSVEGSLGRPATDPRILLALWLYATLEGIVSARVIADYCKEHIAYEWLCGGVSTNHHTLSDFSVKYGKQFDEFLTQSVAILLKQGFIDLEEVSQDGMRVRANAGSSSFRREGKLLMYHEKAKKYLQELRRKLEKNPGADRSKKEAADLRAAEERERRVKQALEELKKLKEEKEKNAKKNRRNLKEEDLEKARSSTTDPESRRMKMACGGFRPGYNVQFATTKKGRVIVGVDVNNRGNDTGLITPMIENVRKKYDLVPSRWLVDAGYADYTEITKASQLYEGCNIYMAPKISGRINKNPYEPKKEDSPGILAWRKRMNTEEGKEIYRGRGSTAEFSNAQARNRGLQQFLVRGFNRVKAVAYRFAIAHNMERLFSMRARMA